MFQDFRIIVMDIKHHSNRRTAIFLHLCSFHFSPFRLDFFDCFCKASNSSAFTLAEIDFVLSLLQGKLGAIDI